MLYLSLTLLNPFVAQDMPSGFESIRYFTRKLTKNWALECCFYTIRGYFVCTNLDIRTRGDHIGLSIALGLMRYKISFEFYNINHAKKHDE